MQVKQKTLEVGPLPRGFHIITTQINDALISFDIKGNGVLHVFIQHTSASLCINENTDPDVREDMEAYLNHYVPENEPYFLHTLEGSDDMPAHIKSVLLGNSLQIPITKGKLNLGTWQGIYMGEHRNHGGIRKLVLNYIGE